MHRLTARLLFILTLVGIFAPVMQAMSAMPPHACCLRKMAQAPGAPVFQAQNCCRRNCCPPLVTAQSMQVVSKSSIVFALAHSFFTKETLAALHTSGRDSLHSGRAPPALSPT